MIKKPILHLRLKIAFFSLIALCGLYGFVSAQVFDGAFRGGVTDAPPKIYVSATLSDGKILVGGEFRRAGASAKNYLARLNPDGTLDTTFNSNGAGPNGSVFDILPLPDGKIIIGGSFTIYNGNFKRGVARLNPDGTFDTTFNNGGIGLFGTAQTLALQPDGKILVSGAAIRQYNGVTRFSLVRLNPDGTLDASFTAPFASGHFVEEVDLLPDGRIYASGTFSVGSPARVNFARLNQDGSLDQTFSSGGGRAGGAIYAQTVQTDGKILIGGAFVSYNGASRQKIARVNGDGSLDQSFASDVPEIVSVEYIAVEPDGKILVAGRFSFPGTLQSYSLVRLNQNGTRDVTFRPPVSNASGYNVKPQPDGKIILTGYFTRIGGTERGGIVRLASSGNIDASFYQTLKNHGSVETIVQQGDGKLVVGGSFEKANGVFASNIVRFNLDGSVDHSFNKGEFGAGGTDFDPAGFNNAVLSIARMPDGKLLIGGSFGSYGGVPRPSLARLTHDGFLDQTFNPTFFDPVFNPIIYRVVPQPDGKIIVAGLFVDRTSGSYTGICRLNPDGSLDATFNAGGSGANGYVVEVKQLTDGKYIIGGSFSAYNNAPRSRIARLNADGTLDAAFNVGSGFDGTVWSVSAQTDNKLLVGGSFSTYNGAEKFNLLRLNADGSLDRQFGAGNGPNGTVLAIEPNNGADGGFWIGGAFTNYEGSRRLALITPDGFINRQFTATIGTPITDSYFYVRKILMTSDAHVYVGGTIDYFGTRTFDNLFRLKPRRVPPGFPVPN